MGASVRVPATSANLGPGFDSFGLALDLHNVFTADLAEEWRVAVVGEGEGELATDGTNRVAVAMARAFQEAGRPELRARHRLLERHSAAGRPGFVLGGDRRRAAARRAARGRRLRRSTPHRARRRDRGTSRQHRRRPARRFHGVLAAERRASVRTVRARPRTGRCRRAGARRARNRGGASHAAAGGFPRRRRVQRGPRRAALGGDRERAARAARPRPRRPAARALPPGRGGRPARGQGDPARRRRGRRRAIRCRSHDDRPCRCRHRRGRTCPRARSRRSGFARPFATLAPDARRKPCASLAPAPWSPSSRGPSWQSSARYCRSFWRWALPRLPCGVSTWRSPCSSRPVRCGTLPRSISARCTSPSSTSFSR